MDFKNCFSRYPSLISLKNKPKLIGKMNQDDKNSLFCLSEKVHGANFCFMVFEQDDQLVFEMAKRSATLKKDEHFFNKGVNQLRQNYMKCCLNLFDYLKHNLTQELSFYKNIKLKEDQILKGFHIYGELFGGHYPHPNVSNSKEKFDKIQDGVYYNNENDFYAFDLVLTLSNKNGETNKLWLCPKHLETLFPTHGFQVYAKSLHTGNIQDLIHVDYHINTTIPQTFYKHLPLIEKNICEGMVLRRYDFSDLNYVPTIFKLKNDDFLEKTKNKVLKNQPIKKFTNEIEQQIIEKIESYLNENRVQSAVSKIGRPDENSKDFKKMRGMIIKEVFNDVLQSFKEDENDLHEQMMQSKDQKSILKNVSKMCTNFVFELKF